MNMRLALRYSIDIQDFGLSPVRSRKVRRLTLPQAWRLVERQARRGLRLYGGNIVYANWGARGGVFPGRYRSAVIRIDCLPHKPCSRFPRRTLDEGN